MMERGGIGDPALPEATGPGQRTEEDPIESMIIEAQGGMRRDPEKEGGEEPELKIEELQWSGGSRIQTTPELLIGGEGRTGTSTVGTVLPLVVGYSHTRGDIIGGIITLGSTTGMTTTLLPLEVTEGPCLRMMRCW